MNREHTREERRAMVRARPEPWAGMLLWAEAIKHWLNLKEPQVLCIANAWRKGWSRYLLPGELGCPDVPTSMRVGEGEHYTRLIDGRWTRPVRRALVYTNHLSYKDALPCPESFAISSSVDTEAGDIVTIGPPLTSDVTLNPCPRCAHELSFPAYEGASMCPACGWPGLHSSAIKGDRPSGRRLSGNASRSLDGIHGARNLLQYAMRVLASDRELQKLGDEALEASRLMVEHIKRREEAE